MTKKDTYRRFEIHSRYVHIYIQRFPSCQTLLSSPPTLVRSRYFPIESTQCAARLPLSGVGGASGAPAVIARGWFPPARASTGGQSSPARPGPGPALDRLSSWWWWRLPLQMRARTMITGAVSGTPPCPPWVGRYGRDVPAPAAATTDSVFLRPVTHFSTGLPYRSDFLAIAS